jgi:uncharacterized protein YkwD
LSVTLTALITHNGQSRSKTFNLTLVDPQYSRPVTLHGVGLGMTLQQAQAVLGAPKNNYALSNTETWYVFHSSYGNFIAVGLVSNSVAAIYSMSSSWASQLKDRTTGAVISAEQADVLAGVGAAAYTDYASASRPRYAVLVYDEAAGIAGYRTFLQDGAEQLILQLLNAFRALNSRSALQWNAKLGLSAREHTADMGSRNYLSETGTGGSTFATRAAAKGYESALVASGAVAGGGVNVFDYLNDYINIANVRSQLLGSSATVAGVGFGSGYGGNYKTLGTVVFGTLIGVTNVTWSPSSVAVNVNGTATVTLGLTPTNRNESFTVASSNTGILTAANSAGALTTVTVTGKSQGSAYITVTGNSSGNQFSIPVSVGTTYASSLTVRNEGGSTIATTSGIVDNAANFILGAGQTYRFTATATPSVAGVAWISSSNIATVDGTGLVTAGSNAGTAKITARVQRSAASNDYISVSVNVSVLPLTLTPKGMAANSASASINLNSASPVLDLSVTAPAASALPAGAVISGYTWTSSNTQSVTLSASAGTSVTATGRAPANPAARVTVTANITGTATSGGGGYFTVKGVSRYIDITVTGQAAWPDSGSVSGQITVDVGQTVEIPVTTSPASVTNRILWADNYEVVNGELVDYSQFIGVSPSGTPGGASVTVTGKQVTGTTPAKVIIHLQTNASGSTVEIPVLVTVKEPVLAITAAPAGGGNGISLNVGQTSQPISAVITPTYAAAGKTVAWEWGPSPSDQGGVTLSATTGNSITVTAVAAGTVFLVAKIDGTPITSNPIVITIPGAVPTG